MNSAITPRTLYPSRRAQVAIKVCPETFDAFNPKTLAVGDEGSPPDAAFLGTKDYPWDFSQTSTYCFNGWLYRTSPSNIPYRNSGMTGELSMKFFVNASGVKDASLIPLFGDGTWAEAWPEANDKAPRNLNDGGYETQNLGSYTAKSYMARYCIDRHNRKTNIVFLDGHGETVPLSSLWQFRWHVDYNLNTPTPAPPAGATYKF